MFEIHKNIPKPTVTRDGAAKYPFGELAIGDMFVIGAASTDEDLAKLKRRAASAINLAHKRFANRRFSQREIANGEVGVWRDADRIEQGELSL